MQHISVLIQHLIKGLSQRRIAVELQLSRNTVKQYVERLIASEMGYDALFKTYKLQATQDLGKVICLCIGKSSLYAWLQNLVFICKPFY